MQTSLQIQDGGGHHIKFGHSHKMDECTQT